MLHVSLAGLGLTCGPGILGHIFAEWWQTCGSFGIEPSAANLAPSSESWYRPSETCQPGASPGMLPDQPWRRSLSYRTGTCPAPETQEETWWKLRFVLQIILTCWGLHHVSIAVAVDPFKFNHKPSEWHDWNNIPPILHTIKWPTFLAFSVVLIKFLTLIRVSSRFLHTSFLSADIMSDFFSNTLYRLKKSGYVHLGRAQHIA